MTKVPTAVAKELLEGGPGGLKDLRMHTFTNVESHDDELTQQLYADFSAELGRVQRELTENYGSPERTGNADDEIIPLNGIFRFAVWSIGDRKLFVAVSHEDRGLPILLMLGTA